MLLLEVEMLSSLLFVTSYRQREFSLPGILIIKILRNIKLRKTEQVHPILWFYIWSSYLRYLFIIVRGQAQKD